MLAITRKTKIKEIISEKKSVTVMELSKLFSVTEETIRRDFKQLEEEGFLTRTYGGAFIQDGVENSIDLAIRQTAYIESKQRIANKCLEIIHNGDSIFLDSSTTAFQIAKVIGNMRLTVVSNSLLIINELCDKENIHLISLGGSYSPKDKAFDGNTALKSLKGFYFDKIFMSCRSLSREYGITDSKEPLATIRQNLIKRGKRVYLIADFSKFNKTSFITISDFLPITGLITDRPLSEDWKYFLAENQVELYEAEDTASIQENT